MFIGSIGAFGNFVNLYLDQVVGLTGAQIGLIMSLGMITTVVMNPIWGYIADKTGKHTFLLKMTFFSAVAVGALYYAASSFLMVVVAAILFEGLRAPTMPMLEYLTTNYADKHNYDFGKIRVYASWGFLLIAMATGFMVAGMEFELFGRQIGFAGFLSLEFAAFGVFIIMSFLALLLVFLLPKSDSENDTVTTVAKKAFGKADVKALLQNRRFVFILILTMLGMATLEAAWNYATMHVVTVLGASEGIISLLAFFMVVPEVVILPLGTVLVLKTGFKNWYILSLISMVGRLLVYSFVTDPVIFALGGVVHGIMIVMHITGTIAYIRKVVPAKSLGLALTVLASGMALSRALFSFVFGFVYDNISSFAVFRIAAAVVLVALILAFKSKHLKTVGDEIGVA